MDSLLKRRPSTGSILLGAAVAVIAVAMVVNGIGVVRDNHGTKRDVAEFNKYLRDNVGPSGFGRPRVKLGRKLDTVCATHRSPRYQLCAQLDARNGHVVRVYQVVRGADGKQHRQPFQP